ncbi:hypothetical protein SH1V18_47220 [Vallitalea longa]|uniref:Uncharacterized protein n=1 Tax=Vallitalea longa TaxID=2936439 RepID=A0A9W5YE23_9FIRM|nr:hypothetical protein [Vallitalea longa]GKX32242.1 hypothetical protein SH1V18_47220 [Vallitalea longa]
MSKLIKSELSKIFHKKIIYLAALIFLILNSINIYNAFQVYDYDLYTIPEEIQKPISQKIYDNNVKYIESGYNYSQLEDQEKQIINTNTAITMAKGNQDIYTEHIKQLEELETLKNTNKSSFDYRNTKLQHTLFGKLPKPYIFNENGYTEIIYYINQYGFVYICILILLGISTMITSEYSTNMDSIIKSSKKGKKQFITSKIIASTIFTFIITLVFNLFNSIPYFLALDSYGWSIPIQNIGNFLMSPYLLTIGSYVLVQFLTHLLGAIIFSLIVLLISSLCRSILASISISSAILALPLVIEQYTYIDGKTPEIINFSLTNILKAEPLFRNYKTYNILGHPILYPYLVIGIYILLIPIIIYLIFYFFRNKQVY